jgi:hypothetical protein
MSCETLLEFPTESGDVHVFSWLVPPPLRHLLEFMYENLGKSVVGGACCSLYK